VPRQQTLDKMRSIIDDEFVRIAGLEIESDFPRFDDFIVRIERKLAKYPEFGHRIEESGDV